MSDIEWTDTVWNPVLGCSRVSAGCQNCYAERFAHRGLAERHRGLTVMGSKGPRWTGEVRLVPEVLGTPLKWRKPRRVFVNSMSDLFHEGVPFEFVAAVFGVMAAAPQHTFQVLTKRPKRALEFFAWAERENTGHVMAHALCVQPTSWPSCVGEEGDGLIDHPGLNRWPLPNVWLGVSVEDQATADERIPLLLECPAAVRWASYEPALGPVDFTRFLRGRESIPGVISPSVGFRVVPRLDWIVVGGESGPGARFYDIQWPSVVITQGRAHGVAVFHKQLGSLPVRDMAPTGDFRTNPETGKREYGLTAERLVLRDRKGGDMSEWPEDLRVRQWPAVVEQVRAELAKEPS